MNTDRALSQLQLHFNKSENPKIGVNCWGRLLLSQTRGPQTVISDT